MATKTVINTRLPKLGPYSNAVRAGDLIFTAGQPGLDPASGQPAGDTFAAQARQAFLNLQAVLDDAGSSMAHVVKVTCFVADASGFAFVNELFAEFFPHDPPVRSTPVVALPRGLLFSIEAVAVVRD